MRPEIDKGVKKAGRHLSEIDICGNPFVITGASEEELDYSKELIRKHLSMYAATHAYKAVMEYHGWGEICDELVKLSRAQRWREMPGLVSDEMLDTFAVTALRDELPAALKQRYSGILTSINPVFGPPYAELQERQRKMFRSLAPIMDALKSI